MLLLRCCCTCGSAGCGPETLWRRALPCAPPNAAHRRPDCACSDAFMFTRSVLMCHDPSTYRPDALEKLEVVARRGRARAR